MNPLESCQKNYKSVHPSPHASSLWQYHRPPRPTSQFFSSLASLWALVLGLMLFYMLVAGLHYRHAPISPQVADRPWLHKTSGRWIRLQRRPNYRIRVVISMKVPTLRTEIIWQVGSRPESTRCRSWPPCHAN